MKKFKFSIIMAVYNVEKYLEESIESVINQTLDFKNNIELILIDDGSIDNSAVICKEYEKKYSQNIKFIHKENGGPSSARNAGIKIATGEYYNFLDSDDLLHKSALEKVYDFFNKHKEIDMVTLPIECIEKEQGLYHRYVKFGNISKVIDLNISPQDYVFSAAASFYRSTVFENTEFSTNLKLAEDLLLNTKLYLKNHKFGFISPNEAVYYYRKRFSNNSISNINSNNIDDWLLNTLEYLHKELLSEAKILSETVPKFLQYIFVYNIVKRLEIHSYVSTQTLKRFYKISESILSHVDDKVITSYNYNNYYTMAMILMFKNKDYDTKNLFYIDSENNICMKGKPLQNIANYSLQISSLKIIDNNLIINGYFNDIIVNGFKIMCYSQDNQKIINELKIEPTSNIFLQKRFFNTNICKTYYVTGEIPISPEERKYYIALCINDSVVPLQLKNIYGEDSILSSQSYDTEYGKFEIKVINKLIYIKQHFDN